MKEIFVIHENNEIITARDTMNHAITASIQRLTICGYLCEEFLYDEEVTVITYRDLNEHETRTMFIEKTNFKEGI